MKTNPFIGHALNRDRLPVAVLSGFLGSGKTTLINAMLRDPRMARTAVAINEFGEIPLDHELIDHGSDRTVVMANGCLCCNLAGDMEAAVMRLFSRRESGEMPRFDRLIVEPSGLSDPAPIMQAILRNPVMARAMRLETIVTTVDALFAGKQLQLHPETRKQIMLADRLVVTKTDLAGADLLQSLRAELQALNPAAETDIALNGEIDPARLFSAAFLDPNAPASLNIRSSFVAESVSGPGHLDNVTAISLTADQPLSWKPFDAWLRTIRITHAENLLRVKGLLHIHGAPGPVLIQGVHHVVHVPVELEAWPSAARNSRLVLITDKALAAPIQASWQAALPKILALA